MTGFIRAMSRAVMLSVCAIGAALLPAPEASASDLSINPALDTSGQGLTIRTRGRGLLTTGTASIDLGSFPGQLRQGVMYWGGSRVDGEPRIDTLHLIDGNGNPVSVSGTLVGEDAGEGRLWYAYRANVLGVLNTFTPGAPIQLSVSSVGFGGDMGGGDPPSVNGFSVIVAFSDPGNRSFYRARIAEGSEFLFGGDPKSDGASTPITYLFDPAVVTRPAQLSIAVANADPVLRDWVSISDNPLRIDELVSAEGPRWDNPTFSVFVPASRASSTIQVISPPVFGNNADRLHVIAMSYRLICGGQIGDFVWADQNGNGLQDPGEAGIQGVRLVLELFDDLTGEFVPIAETLSDSSGAYLFEGICAGLYRVKADPETFPKGVVPVPPFQGDDPTIDSDFELEGDGFYYAYVELPNDGASNLDIDLGLTSAISIFVGACCFPDGSCAETFAAQCIAAGGTFAGIQVPCAAVEPCPQPLVACCLPDGTCVEVTAAACVGKGGQPQTFPELCADVMCEQPLIACCLPDGSCIEVTAEACVNQGGQPQTFPELCADVMCEQPLVACCLPDGSCVEVTAESCANQGGAPQPFPSSCDRTDCAQPAVACCLPDGSCIQVTADECDVQGGQSQGFPSVCLSVVCEQPLVACCLPDGSCVEVTAESCALQGGEPQMFPELCADVSCAQPLVACCLPDGTCVEVVADDCSAQGGQPQPFPALCVNVSCLPPTDPMLRVRAAEKGSILYFSKVDVRWNDQGSVIRDTFLSLTNDHPDDVRVLMYFINGDAPIEATDDQRAHPGWNFLDNAITLTGNQPIFWSAATGSGTLGGLSPFFVLDPGSPPGRPVGDGSGDRMIRGFVVGWATRADGQPIRFNHLSGAATIVDYREASAWEYPAFAFRGVAGTHGSPIGLPGTLKLDGADYAFGYELLLASFSAVGSASMSSDGRLVQVFGQTTLHPVDLDVRLNAFGAGPVTTRVLVDVWNENEVKFSGMSLCVTCWSSRMLDEYLSPNQFRLDHLQTERGKARFRSSTGPACDGSAPHDLVSMLGLIEHRARFDGSILGEQIERFGRPMHGMGLRSAVIRYDVEGLPPEAPAQSEAPVSQSFEEIDRWLEQVLRDQSERRSRTPR